MKTIVVLLGLNAEYEIIEADTGIAFPTGKLVADNWVALYVATSHQDASFAIEHYKENGTLADFIKAQDVTEDGSLSDSQANTNPKRELASKENIER